MLSVLIAIHITGCTTQNIPDPHQHVVDVHAQPWNVEDVEDSMLARLVWVDPPPTDHLREGVTNQGRTARAYIVDKPWVDGTTREYIQIQRLPEGQVLELNGIPFRWRPFSDLVWSGDRYLIFDRWTNPHFGRHFVVDITKKRLVLLASFPDQFYLDQQKPKQ